MRVKSNEKKLLAGVSFGHINCNGTIQTSFHNKYYPQIFRVIYKLNVYSFLMQLFFVKFDVYFHDIQTSHRGKEISLVENSTCQKINSDEPYFQRQRDKEKRPYLLIKFVVVVIHIFRSSFKDVRFCQANET